MKKILALLALLPALALAGCDDTSEPSSVDTVPPVSLDSSFEDSEDSVESVKEWKEVLTDGDVTVTDVPTEIVIGAANDYVIKLDYSSIVFNSKAEFAVSDETVIPVEALEYKTSGDSQNDYGEVHIDAEKLSKAGECFVEIAISSPNASSQGGTVCVPLNVVETPEVTYWDETLTFTATDKLQRVGLEEGQKFIAQFTDNDHVNGTENPNVSDGKESNTYNWFEKDISGIMDDEPVEISFKYAVGHHFKLRAYIVGADGKVVSWYTINDSVGEGSSSTGFNEYDNETASLTFIQDNASLELTVTEKSYS